MNNFLEFILKDIDTKTSVLENLPTKTKTNQKKYNDKIQEYTKKYTEYEANLKKYLLAKSHSFELKEEEQGNLDALKNRVSSLEHVKFLLNPANTYYEKMGFDELMYQISNYETFNFNSLNEIINAFLDKFMEAGISLTGEDFSYTCYVEEYMTAFLEVRNQKLEGHERLASVFEKIYWVNPDIIAHIELNFRKLIRENAKWFNAYIEALQEKAKQEAGVQNYLDCLNKLKDATIDEQNALKENVDDIIDACESGEMDINSFMQDSKARTSAYEFLVPETVDKNDVGAMQKVCTVLQRLYENVIEYKEYMRFESLLQNFKTTYKDTKKPTELKKGEISSLHAVLNKITENEQALEKLNRKIKGNRNSIFDFKHERDLKELKSQSVIKAQELSELYKQYDEEYFKDKVMDIISPTMTVADVLHLYYSFDYFKKNALQKIFNLNNYEDVKSYSKEFAEFANNPMNVIMEGVPIFSETNIPKIIANKYRLNGIKIDEMDLSIDNIENLSSRILLILRIHKVETSKTSVEKIWFRIEVKKLITDREGKES